MSPLIKVQPGQIGGVSQPTVDARELWDFIKPYSPFGDWMYTKLKQHKFQEGSDFERVHVHREIQSGLRKRVVRQVDYVISVSMAERIGALEFCRGPHPWV